MNFDVPEDCRYLESHEWVRREGETVRLGVSDFAQDELGDVVFVELPEEGATIARGDAFGVIESIKAVSDLYAPVSGAVVARNSDLRDMPELVNEEPYGDGWMLEIDPDGDVAAEELLSPGEYREQTE